MSRIGYLPISDLHDSCSLHNARLAFRLVTKVGYLLFTYARLTTSSCSVYRALSRHSRGSRLRLL